MSEPFVPAWGAMTDKDKLIHLYEVSSCKGLPCPECPISSYKSGDYCGTTGGNTILGVAVREEARLMLKAMDDVEKGVSGETVMGPVTKFEVGHWYRCKKEHIRSKPENTWDYVYDGVARKCLKSDNSYHAHLEGIEGYKGGFMWGYFLSDFEEVPAPSGGVVSSESMARSVRRSLGGPLEYSGVDMVAKDSVDVSTYLFPNAARCINFSMTRQEVERLLAANGFEASISKETRRKRLLRDL